MQSFILDFTRSKTLFSIAFSCDLETLTRPTVRPIKFTFHPGAEAAEAGPRRQGEDRDRDQGAQALRQAAGEAPGTAAGALRGDRREEAGDRPRERRKNVRGRRLAGGTGELFSVSFRRREERAQRARAHQAGAGRETPCIKKINWNAKLKSLIFSIDLIEKTLCFAAMILDYHETLR